MRIKVYIAGPFTNGDQSLNVRRAVDNADELLKLGFIPFVPHLAQFWHYVHPNPYELWMGWCLEWVRQCDCLLRLPGESKGAGREEAMARKSRLPVFYSLQELVDYYKEKNG